MTAIATANANRDKGGKSPYDAIIIGAGVIGQFHAYHARELGLRVLLLERSSEPRQASVRNFGMVIPSAMPPGAWRDRALASADLYRKLASDWGLTIRQGGTVYLATTAAERDLLDEFQTLAPGLGYDCRLATRSEAVRLNPRINPATCMSALHARDDLRIESRSFLRAMLGRLSDDPGVDVRTGTACVRIEPNESGCEVRNGDGRCFAGRHAFVCNGSEFRLLFADRFADSGLIHCRLQMMTTVPQPGPIMPTTIASGLSLRRYEAFRIASSWERLKDEPIDPDLVKHGIHVLFAQDEDGRVVIGDSHDYRPIAEDHDERLDARIEELIVNEAKRLVQLGPWEIAERWQGVYALHPDREVWLDDIDECIHIITGIGGKGMTVGPALARESLERNF